MVWAPPGVEMNTPGLLAAQARTRSSTWATRSRVGRGGQQGSGARRGRGGRRRVRAEARGRRSREGARGRDRRWCGSGSGRTRRTSGRCRGGDFEAARGRGRGRRSSTASSTTAPQARRSSRAARIAEPRGDEARPLLDHAGPAHRALRALGRARRCRRTSCGSSPPTSAEASGPSCRSTRRRRSSRARQAPRAAGQVDRDALGAHDDEPPRARPDQLRHADRQARRHGHGLRARRSSPTSAPTSSCSRRSSRRSASRSWAAATAFPAIDLHFTGVFTNKMCTDAIRGAGRPGGDVLDRADDEPPGRRAGDGPARAAAQELHRQGPVPVRDPDGDRLRLGDYHGALDRLLRELRPRRVPPRAGEPARRGRLPRRRASRPGSRSAAWRPRGRSGLRASGLQAAFCESANVA